MGQKLTGFVSQVSSPCSQPSNHKNVYQDPGSNSDKSGEDTTKLHMYFGGVLHRQTSEEKQFGLMRLAKLTEFSCYEWIPTIYVINSIRTIFLITMYPISMLVSTYYHQFSWLDMLKFFRFNLQLDQKFR